MDRGGVRAAVGDRDATEQIFGAGFGILYNQIKVALLRKGILQRIEQFKLRVCIPASPILLHQSGIGIGYLWIFIEHFHVGVCGRVVKIKVVLLHVFAVVTFWPRQAKHALFEDRILFIPERHGQAELLRVITNTGHAVFAPAVRPAAGMVVREKTPGIARCAIVFAHRTPGALTHIRSPAFPVGTLCHVIG